MYSSLPRPKTASRAVWLRLQNRLHSANERVLFYLCSERKRPKSKEINSSSSLHNVAWCVVVAFLVQSSGASFIILFTRNLDHISVVVNIFFTLLLQDKSYEEFIQDTDGRQEFYAATVGFDGQNLWNKVGSNLPPQAEQPKHRKETCEVRE
jgi:hypothetical protein